MDVSGVNEFHRVLVETSENIIRRNCHQQPQLQGLVIRIVRQGCCDQVAEQCFVDTPRRNVIADVFHVTQKLAGAIEVAVEKQHLGAQRDGDALVAILKAMELASAEK